MMRRGLTLLAATAAVAALVLSGCSSGSSGAGSGKSFVAGDGAVTQLAVQDRGLPVELSGHTLTGDQLDVASLRGKPVVVNVWASWCSPCRDEAPDLQAAYLELKPQGVAFIGIDSRDDDLAAAKAFQESFGITYPSLVDEGGALLLALRGVVAPKSVPTTLVLDAQGRVAARVNGKINKTTLLGLVHDAGLPAGATG